MRSKMPALTGSFGVDGAGIASVIGSFGARTSSLAGEAGSGGAVAHAETITATAAAETPGNVAAGRLRRCNALTLPQGSSILICEASAR
jgi:hypothetical protein